MGISRGTWLGTPPSRTRPVHKVLNRLFLVRDPVAGNTTHFSSVGPSNATLAAPRSHHTLNYSPAPSPKSAPSSPTPHQRLTTSLGRSHYTTTIRTPHARLLRPGAPTTTNCLVPSPTLASSFFSAHLPPTHAPVMSMASYPFSSASSSDISTPRSASPSPSSVASIRSSRSSISNKRMSMSSRRMTDFNPMSSVDINAIEEKMRMASLDQHRGYSQNTFGEVQQYRTTEYVPKTQATAYQILREPLWNKASLLFLHPPTQHCSESFTLPRMASLLSRRVCRLPLRLLPRAPIHTSSQLTAMVESGLSFTPEERVTRNLTGLIPHTMESLQTQCQRAMKMINTRQTDVDKYLYLSSLKAQNFDLFYRLLMDNIRELMPLVYTPTIGDVCLQYSTLYTRPEALYISIKQRKSIRTMLRNWPYPNPQICVVTDGSRILGLGDLGVNGVGISIGKLALYTGAAGIHPENTLPIVLDTGTNNETNLKDPFYLGIRSKRVSVAEQQAFMDEFMEAATEVYPNMTVQFEDFESEKAFNYLDRYRNKYRCFNDDIQGTGAVVLAGYINAVELSGVPLEEQRLVFMGAGSAGVGVAKQLVEYYTKRGLSEQVARDKFWLVDTKGLVTKDRGDKLAEHKKYFARTDNNGHQFRTLEEVIEYVKPTALVGLTATFGVFTESVVRALKASVDSGGLGRRPILFPLSNPLTKAECTFEQAVQWTDGTAIFASGSPFSPFTMKTPDGQAITYHPNQGNNVYVFPGLGLGAILAKASKVTDDMVYTSAAALAASLNADEIHKGLIYPRIERVRDASIIVAREVMKSARRDGVSTLPESQWVEWEEWGDVALDAWIKERIYDPISFSEKSRI
ncbi:Malic enzyme [Colletotrichum higginsianum IMI 349063]|uniref:Malic enzyme n=2 Tax=Colletotrichum higginsianum (strain IMI 349063) TaxID=759273 RepID=A0A1B7YI88_COLHI|nr:Malic enzyme [Colletotrichum higginsianum IMI 349063]OBR11799.1 Malic enzyme [Colletotrichum higginsianum IMI 349063]